MDEASVHATSLQLYIQSSEFNVTHYFVGMFSIFCSAFVLCFTGSTHLFLFLCFFIKVFNASIVSEGFCLWIMAWQLGQTGRRSFTGSSL